ncbi:hypothetical protein CMI42_06475, partial [Candidatus Pacearchaeota archaeon]|nr:hypothetical protein [Candidatus Pacearchaeota archaeon]
TNVGFDVFFDKATCVVVDENLQAFFPDSFLDQSYWITRDEVVSSQLDCYREEGVNLDGEVQQTCCPIGYACGNDNRCEFTGQSFCSDFSEEDCDGNEAVASSELDDLLNDDFGLGCSYWEKYGDVCAEFVDCQCEWRDSEWRDSKCQAVSDHKVQDLTDNSAPIQNWDYNSLPSNISELCSAGSDTPQSGKCSFDFKYEGNCNDGDEFVVRSWIVHWDQGDGGESARPGYCEDDSDTVICGNVVKLGFFSLWNLLIVVLGLVVFYGFVLGRKG